MAIDDQQSTGLWVTPDADDLAEQRVIGLGVLQGPGDATLAFALAGCLELQPGGVSVDLSDRRFPHLGIARHGVATVHRRHRAGFIGHRVGRPRHCNLSVGRCFDEVSCCCLHVSPGVIKTSLGLNALLLPQRRPGPHVHVRLGDVRRRRLALGGRLGDAGASIGIGRNFGVRTDGGSGDVDCLPRCRRLGWDVGISAFGGLASIGQVDDRLGHPAEAFDGCAGRWANKEHAFNAGLPTGIGSSVARRRAHQVEQRGVDRCAALLLDPSQHLISQRRACVKARVIDNRARRSTLSNDRASSNRSPCRNASDARSPFGKGGQGLGGLDQRLRRPCCTCNDRHIHGRTTGSFQALGRQEEPHGPLDESAQYLFCWVLILDLRQGRRDAQQLGVRGANWSRPAHCRADDVGRCVAEHTLCQASGRSNNQPRRWLRVLTDVFGASGVISAKCFADVTGTHERLTGRHKSRKSCCLQVSKYTRHHAGRVVRLLDAGRVYGLATRPHVLNRAVGTGDELRRHGLATGVATEFLVPNLPEPCVSRTSLALVISGPACCGHRQRSPNRRQSPNVFDGWGSGV